MKVKLMILGLTIGLPAFISFSTAIILDHQIVQGYLESHCELVGNQTQKWYECNK